MMIRALIFDFDGVIIDTEHPMLQSWQEVFEAYGCHLPLSVWATRVGSSSDTFSPYEYLERQLGRPVDRPAIRSEFRKRYLDRIISQPLSPGLRDYINRANRLGLKLGVASNSSNEWVSSHLSRLDLSEQFQCTKCSGDVERIKPHPDLYNAVLGGLDIGGNEAIAFEDSPDGILAAKRAGVFCVGVPNALTRRRDLMNADLRLTSFTQMPLERLLLEVERKTRG